MTRIYHPNKNYTPDFFELFRQYILWGFTYKALASLSGYSIQYLSNKFHEFLIQDSPQLPLIDQSDLDEAFLLIDGLWFGRWFVLMVYRQSKNLTIMHISTMGKEVTTKISRDLGHLKNLDYHFTGIVSDGGTGIVGAVNRVYPHIPHQICLAHMHRRIVSMLGKKPKDDRVKKLRILADHVWLIESREALRWWETELNIWIRRNWWFIHERRKDTEGKWWYIHKGVRKAARMLTILPEISFTFLTHPTMPKTTNELEAQFGHLGRRWIAHTGLKEDRWKDFLKWFVYFYNKEKLSQSKRKEAVKNNTTI